ncbi:hypothetical protein ACOME3_003413 [Neoechinorhynchus agilis]
MSAEHNIVDGVEGDNALDAQSNQPYIVARTTVANARTRVRNNSWGPFTYADLIESAILKLSKIYSWFATNIPYFSERTTVQASKQWKNSIRHNLSGRDMFRKIPNSRGIGPSLWIIDPEYIASGTTKRTWKRPSRNIRRRGPYGSVFSRRRGTRANERRVPANQIHASAPNQTNPPGSYYTSWTPLEQVNTAAMGQNIPYIPQQMPLPHFSQQAPPLITTWFPYGSGGLHPVVHGAVPTNDLFQEQGQNWYVQPTNYVHNQNLNYNFVQNGQLHVNSAVSSANTFEGGYVYPNNADHFVSRANMHTGVEAERNAPENVNIAGSLFNRNQPTVYYQTDGDTRR